MRRLREGTYIISTPKKEEAEKRLNYLAIAKSGRRYILPGARTSINVSDGEHNSTMLDIRTSRRGKVEKNLVKLLDELGAGWDRGSDPGMRKQDVIISDLI